MLTDQPLLERPRRSGQAEAAPKMCFPAVGGSKKAAEWVAPHGRAPQERSADGRHR
jgi:hypothetical protein